MEWYWIVAIIIGGYIAFAFFQSLLVYFYDTTMLFGSFKVFVVYQLVYILLYGGFVGAYERDKDKRKIEIKKLEMQVESLKDEIKKLKQNENAS